MVDNLSMTTSGKYHEEQYLALAKILEKANYSFELLNFSLNEENLTSNGDYFVPLDIITTLPAVKVFFYCLYFCIFLIGISGNILVCYVVFRNKSMHNVTNLFITNLALSDILLCTFAVPFTPLYLFMHEWVFGSVLCHLVPYAQGVSVYISAFTLMSIAIDRFFVIIYPFKPRLPLGYSMMIILLIWITAGMLTLPYGIFMDLVPSHEGRPYCDEGWPYDFVRKLFGFSTSILQFIVPFFVITFCYLRVCVKLRDRARFKPGANSQRKMELEMNRTRRLNRMLITMVIIFGVSWLPLNIYNLILDFYIPAASWPYLNAFFFISHSVAMSSTCYNPFLYAWLNENFRKEFKVVLPCYNSRFFSGRSLNTLGHNRTCNGQPTVQDGTSRAVAMTNTGQDGTSRAVTMTNTGQDGTSRAVTMTNTCQDETSKAVTMTNTGQDGTFRAVTMTNIGQDETSRAVTMTNASQDETSRAVTMTSIAIPVPQGKTTTVKYCPDTDSVQLQIKPADKAGISV